MALLRRVEQARLALALLVLGRVASLPGFEILAFLFEFERRFRQRLHHFKGQEAEAVDDVVVGLAVGQRAEAGPLAEALALAEGKGCLAAFAEMDVLVFGHVLGAFVGGFKALESYFVHAVFLVVFLILQVWCDDGEHVLNVPRENDLIPLVLFRRITRSGSGTRHVPGDGIVSSYVGVAALVIRILGGFADVFPGEKFLEPCRLGLVVANDEEHVMNV